MKLARTIVVELDPDLARRRVAEYFRTAGYAPGEDGPFLTFRRNRSASTWIAFTPRRWGVEATVQIEPVGGGLTEVTARLEITTAGQLFISQLERDFWRAELDGLEQAVESGSADHEPAEAMSRTAVRQNVLAVAVWGVAMLLGLVLLDGILPLGVIALAALVAGGVATWGLVRWFDRRRRVRV
jgi:hypothetical protein